MKTLQDTALVLVFSTLLAGASLFSLSRTDLGDVSSGWTNGSYQRGYENRFEASVPGQKLAGSAWAALRWGLFREASDGAVVGQNGWLFTAEEFQEPENTRDFREELETAEAILSEAGIALVPVVVPDKARMHVEKLPRGRSAPFVTRYDRALETVESVGLAVIDLRPALKFDLAFLRQDTHWSPEGARRSANAVAAATQIDLPIAAVTTKPLGQSPFEGDLLNFVNTGPFRAWVGPQPDQIERFETTVETEGGLFGDAPIPVVLVGTSYSALPAFHFEGFLKQALSADVLNAAAVGQGPFEPMDKFLSDLNTLTSPPSLVIWEIPERFLSTKE